MKDKNHKDRYNDEEGTKKHHGKIPVTVGEEILITPTGRAEKDYYYSFNGFILFLKGLPTESATKMCKFKIKAVKSTFGFAEYMETIE